MELKINKEISKPLIIEGFPGFGLIGAIATEFLISHLKTELIGEILLPEIPATIAIHDSKVVHPIGIYYNEKYNLIIIHSITPPQGIEWKVAEQILDLARQVNAWEIISLEGVGSNNTGDTEEIKTYFYSSKDENKKRLKGLGLEELREGIIIGVTSALLLHEKEFSISAIFAETHSQLPDSKAAAKVIEILDKYLGLEVDYNPLLDTAKKFEEKIRGMIDQSAKTVQEKDKKAMSYVG